MDLGTNTFHLLIAEGPINDPKELLHLYEPVKLGEGGINKGFIQTAAYARGIATMLKFQENIAKYGVSTVKAIATSALRSTSNGKDFIAEVRAKTGINIEVINGDREAAYIYNGVKASGCLAKGNSLIIDIGGGSVEFIIGNDEGITWKQSFEIGAQRLMDKFHQADPIPLESTADLHHYLDEILSPLFEAVKNTGIKVLIGSSGAFETFAEIIELSHDRTFDLKKVKAMPFERNDFIRITNQLIRSSHQQRETMRGIIPLRVDMIVVASLISRYIMEKLEIQEVAMSMYSLKEGVLAEVLNQSPDAYATRAS